MCFYFSGGKHFLHKIKTNEGSKRKEKKETVKRQVVYLHSGKAPINAYHGRVSIIAPVCTALAVICKVKCSRRNVIIVFRHRRVSQSTWWVHFFNTGNDCGALAWPVGADSFAAGTLDLSY